MKTKVILYQAYIPVQTNGLVVRQAEFVETDKQFRSIGDRPYLVPKNRLGEPGYGYARSPEEAIRNLQLDLERNLNRLQGEVADIYGKLNIIDNQSRKVLHEF